MNCKHEYNTLWGVKKDDNILVRKCQKCSLIKFMDLDKTQGFLNKL